jgi:pilus assembly protein Flp/PilA
MKREQVEKPGITTRQIAGDFPTYPKGGTFMLTIFSNLYSFLRDEEGQSLAEYALILVLVSIAAIAALTALGGQISSVFDTITSTLSST